MNRPSTPSEPSPPNRNKDVCDHVKADPFLGGGLLSSFGILCCQCKFWAVTWHNNRAEVSTNSNWRSCIIFAACKLRLDNSTRTLYQLNSFIYIYKLMGRVSLVGVAFLCSNYPCKLFDSNNVEMKMDTRFWNWLLKMSEVSTIISSVSYYWLTAEFPP